MVTPVRAAVFPVAGRGTRFLPATKAIPKEMLPIVDKPLIQFAVEEALAAGVTKLVFIVSATKAAIRDHFEQDAELEEVLSKTGKKALLRSVKNIVPENVSCVYIDQGAPLGLGHAVLCARSAIGNEPFFVHLADDLILAETPCLSQMAEEHARHGQSVVAVEQVEREDTSSYGIVAVKDSDDGQRMTEIIEKPAPQDAPSDLAVVGRYLLMPDIWDNLESIGQGAGGEIQLTDAIAMLLQDRDVYAYSFSGIRYDCGSKLGYLKAMVAGGLVDGDIGESLRAYLADSVS